MKAAAPSDQSVRFHIPASSKTETPSPVRICPTCDKKRTITLKGVSSESSTRLCRECIAQLNQSFERSSVPKSPPKESSGQTPASPSSLLDKELTIIHAAPPSGSPASPPSGNPAAKPIKSVKDSLNPKATCSILVARSKTRKELEAEMADHKKNLLAAAEAGDVSKFDEIWKKKLPFSIQTREQLILQNIDKCKGGTVAILQKLLEINILLESWGDALGKAVESDRHDVLKLLFDHPPAFRPTDGSWIDLVRDLFKKNLIRAAELGHLHSVQCMLVQKGYRTLKEFDAIRGLAVQAAAKTGKIFVIRSLLLEGKIPEESRKKALKIAEENHHSDIVDLLAPQPSGCLPCIIS